MKKTQTDKAGPTGIFTDEFASEKGLNRDFDLRFCRAFLKMFGKRNFSLNDFGCGPGLYTEKLSTHFKEANGYDGNSPNSFGWEKEPSSWNYHKVDLTAPNFIPRPADVSLCLEVGEHIPYDLSSQFLENITFNTEKWLILSWAQPGLGGIGHVNTLRQEVVAERVEKLGFELSPVVGKKLRLASSIWYLKNTIQAYKRK